MPAKPTVTKMKFGYTGGSAYLDAFLKNEGTSLLQPGSLIIRNTWPDGTVQDLPLFNNTALAPGETTRLRGDVPPPPGPFQVVRYKFSLSRYEEVRGETHPLEDIYNVTPKRKGCSPILLLGILAAAAAALVLS